MLFIKFKFEFEYIIILMLPVIVEFNPFKNSFTLDSMLSSDIEATLPKEASSISKTNK